MGKRGFGGARFDQGLTSHKELSGLEVTSSGTSRRAVFWGQGGMGCLTLLWVCLVVAWVVGQCELSFPPELP